MSELSVASDSRLWQHAFQRWAGINALAADRDPDIAYNRFRPALASVAWLADFMRNAARETESQRGAWRQAEERRARVERGYCLAPISEGAFGRQVSANNWPSDARHATPTPFMEFYGRIVASAFSEEATPDLSGVLKDAFRMHRVEPIEFAESMIPGLSGAQSASSRG